MLTEGSNTAKITKVAKNETNILVVLAALVVLSLLLVR
jgi:hypothetical protein